MATKEATNILMSYAHYPISAAIMFKRAFRHLGFKVFSVGPFHQRIPWAPGMDFSRYYDPPDLLMSPHSPGDLEYVLNHPDVKAFNPEVMFQFDAAYWLVYRADAEGEGGMSPPIHTVHVATDPHCIDYVKQFKVAYAPVSMQLHYADAKKYKNLPLAIQWVPYAFDPRVHYWVPGRKRTHDVTLISGLMYENRVRALDRFRSAGLTVRHEVGLLYEEGTEVYNEGLIAFNWSSQLDLPMRFWEGLAYRNVVLTNRVPDLEHFPEFQENVHYLAFDTLDECVEKARWAVTHPVEARRIADKGYARVWIGRHTYNQRALRLLRIAGVKV